MSAPNQSTPEIGSLFGTLVDEIFGAPATPRRGRGKSQKSLDLIDAAREIARDANPITVRGIAYKLFTRGFITSMSRNETSKVSRLLTDAREQGLIPWEWIVDETREAERVQAWSNPSEIINAAVSGYRRDYWMDQPKWVEVWSEKGTVRGVLNPVLQSLGVTFRVMHGFGSATALHDIAEETQQADRPLIVLYVGDWDPSGMFMSEIDAPKRIARYSGECVIRRIALSDADIGPDLPSFSASTKTADPRHQWFVERYGSHCWELDAMDPNALRERVRESIEALIDASAWNRSIEVEAVEVDSMHEFHRAWKSSILGQDAKCSGGGR